MWGWCVLFLLSVVLIFVGYYVCCCVEESLVFIEFVECKEKVKMLIV